MCLVPGTSPPVSLISASPAPHPTFNRYTVLQQEYPEEDDEDEDYELSSSELEDEMGGLVAEVEGLEAEAGEIGHGEGAGIISHVEVRRNAFFSRTLLNVI